MSSLSQHNFNNTLQQLHRMLQQGKQQEVIRQAHGLIKRYPNQPDIYHLLAIAYKQLGDFDNARDSFEQCLAINSKQPQVLNNYANLLAANQMQFEAEQLYQKATGLDTSYVDAWKNLAIVLLAQRKLNEAMKAINTAWKQALYNTSVLTIKADIYRVQENFPSAIEHYQKVLQINPSYVNALHNLGLTYKLMEQHEHAFACFTKARELAPQLSQVDFNMANTLFEQGKYEQAEQFYWSALNKKPSDVEVHQTLNEFYWQRNHKEKFGHSFKLAIEHLPKTWQYDTLMQKLCLKQNCIKKRSKS